ESCWEKMMGVVAASGLAPSTRSSARTRMPPKPCSGSAATAAAISPGGTCTSRLESSHHSGFVAITMAPGQPGLVVDAMQRDQLTWYGPLDPDGVAINARSRTGSTAPLPRSATGSGG